MPRSPRAAYPLRVSHAQRVCVGAITPRAASVLADLKHQFWENNHKEMIMN